MAKNTKLVYTEDDITFFKNDIEKIKAKPTMYIGPVTEHGVSNIIFEAISNSIDEARAGRNSLVHFKYDSKKNEAYIIDEGVGIPVGVHKKAKISTLTHVITALQSSGKMSSDAYKAAGGCFVYDTKVRVLDSRRSVSIGKLADKFSKDNKRFWVYAFDLNGDTAFVPRKASAHLTKYVDEIAIVKLDNGEKIKCTVDHPFLSFTGEYIEAQNLKVGQSLRALHTKLDKDGVANANNHQVVSVRIKRLKQAVPVYCLTVEDNHNFLLDAGVFVSNTHGVGITAANALSSEFEVWTYRKDSGGWHHTYFENGVEKSKVKKTKKVPFGLKKGTIIRMIPSKDVFKKAKANIVTLEQRSELAAFINNGLKIIFEVDGKEKVFFSKNGLSDYVDKKLKDLGCELFHKKMFTINVDNVEVCFAFTDANGSNVDYFTNSIYNLEGGFHEQAFIKSFKEAIKTFAGPKAKYTDKDLFDGVVGILNYNIDEPRFDSQTKEKLVDDRVPQPCYDTLYPALRDFFLSNKTLAKDWVKRAQMIHEKTKNLLKDKKLAAGIKSKKAELNKKLAPVTGKVPLNKCSLFLVEGDSAGGCHIGATKVKLDNGQSKTFEQLVTDFENDIDNYGLAFDNTNKEVKRFLIDAPRITKYVDTLLEIVFDNSEEPWRGTPDHLFLLENGKYKQAKDLTEHDIIRCPL